MKKCVIIGLGNRGYRAYGKTIYKKYSNMVSIIGLVDLNVKRAEYASANLGNATVYRDFDSMLRECKPDFAIITTIDKDHKDYILRCLENGIDVICEKPLTVNHIMCKEILEAEKKYDRKVKVTFNCRFSPFFRKIKELMSQNVIGKVLSVDLEWLLNTSHGADYFRRWHRRMENSGGLLVHKATHHFDVVNWLIEQKPLSVYANGSLRFYGKNGSFRGERCSNCEHAGTCKFVYENINDTEIRAMYYDAEAEDGYFRDRCVFSEEIDIYDTMSLSVKYTDDVMLTYSLVAHSPYEGWKMSISGTEGRLEAETFSSGLNAGNKSNKIRIYDRSGNIVTHDVLKLSGAHGGSDELLINSLLMGMEEDTLGQLADTEAGVLSAIIGIAANISIKEQRLVTVEELLGQ